MPWWIGPDVVARCFEELAVEVVFSGWIFSSFITM